MAARKCPECGSRKTRITKTVPHDKGTAVYWFCNTCHARWQEG